MGKKNKEIKMVSKTSMFLGWLLLIILVGVALGITYLKFFGPNDNLEEHPIEKETISPVVEAALQTLVDNFNNNDLINEYKSQNIDITATLNGTSIVIEYNTSDVKMYEFYFESPKLNVTVNNNDIENFKIIYKIMVYANQKRLDNNSNIDNYIDGFLNNSLEVDGLEKVIGNDTSSYSIDVSKIIGETSNLDNQTITNDDSNAYDNNLTNNEEGV